MTADPPKRKLRKGRLRRLDRIFVASPIYFVTACTFKRCHVLANRAIHQTFLDFAAAGEGCGAYVGAYVIMADHVHLFVALEQATSLSAWMKSLKNSFSRILRNLEIAPPHWQK